MATKKVVSGVERLAPVSMGAIAGTIGGRAVAPVLSQIPIVAENKEIVSSVVIITGILGRGSGVGGNRFWDGVAVSGLVSLIDNIAIRFGYDLL